MNSCILPCRAHFLGLAAALALPVYGGVNVLTEHNDNGRTGANLNETLLTTANVNTRQFGKLFEHSLDGFAHAQPLVVTGVTIPGKGKHDIVIIATEHDVVYAFDAHDNKGANASPLWTRSFVDPSQGITFVDLLGDYSQLNDGELGISATPVIDAATNTLYVVAATILHEPSPLGGFMDTARHHLHALDVRTGAEKPGSPVLITGAVPGRNLISSTPQLNRFYSSEQTSVSALLLVNNTVYVAFEHGSLQLDNNGWIMGYNKSTLQQTSVFNTTPDGYGGGISMSGTGLSADAAGNIYCTTGDGSFDITAGGSHFGNNFAHCALKLAPDGRGGMAVKDFFSPSWSDFGGPEAALGLGEAGVLLLPDARGTRPQRAVVSDIAGRTMILNRDHLGGYSIGQDDVLRLEPWGNGPQTGMAYFDGRLYFQCGAGLPLRSVDIESGTMDTRLTSGFFFSPGIPSISANGAENGIVWVVSGRTPDYYTSHIADLTAYDAKHLAQPLFSTEDNAYPGNRINVASVNSRVTVANGKVYVTDTLKLHVFGLRSDTSELTVSPHGDGVDGGTTSPLTGGERLVINKTYTITAKPNADCLFAGWWTPDSVQPLSLSPTLTFAMAENLALYPMYYRRGNNLNAGTYTGLAVRQTPTGMAAGPVTLALAKWNTFTARIAFGDESLVMAGLFKPSGEYSTVIKRAGKPDITLVLNQALNAGGVTITGSATDGITTVNIIANRAYPQRDAARYTLVLNASNQPGQYAGNGYATIGLAANGILTLAGVLSDGTAFTQTTVVTPAGAWVLFATPYKGRGSVYAAMTLDTRANGIYGMSGDMIWSKPLTKTPAFIADGRVLGSSYNPAFKPLVSFLDGTHLETTGAGFTLPVPPKTFTNGPGNTIVLTNGTTGFTLKYVPSVGIAYGAFTDADGKPHAYRGVVRQYEHEISGMFMNGVNVGGFVVVPAQRVF